MEGELLREILKRSTATAGITIGTVMWNEHVGDALLSDMLRNFVCAEHPLLQFAEPFEGKIDNREFFRSILELTEDGRRVLAGRTDHVALNGVDRWISGVHLEGKQVHWRWDRKVRSVVSASVPRGPQPLKR